MLNQLQIKQQRKRQEMHIYAEGLFTILFLQGRKKQCSEKAVSIFIYFLCSFIYEHYHNSGNSQGKYLT